MQNDAILISGVWIVAAGFVLNLIIQIRGGAWNTAKRETELKDVLKRDFDELRRETTQNIAELNRDMNDGFRTAADRFGETVAALKEKVHLTEMGMVDKYLDKKEYYRHAEAVMKTVEAIDGKLNSRIDHQDSKIERLSKLRAVES